MKIINTAIFLVFISVATTAVCDDHISIESKQQAEIMLETSGTEKMMALAVEQMLQVQLQQNPALTPYKDIMMKFIDKHMSYRSLKPELVNLYAETFSTEELKDLTEFYQTPTGKKAIEKMPEIMAKGSQLGAMRIQSNITELQEMIKQEAERLKLLQTQ